MEKRYFVTGANGCVGAWVVKNLVEAGREVYGLVQTGYDTEKLKIIMTEEALSRIHFVEGDIRDEKFLDDVISQNGITHVIHLAAMQLPLCRKNPVLGSQVDVTGTINMFETIRKHGIQRMVYASSTAVYGYASEYPNSVFNNDSPFMPHSLYGVYKVANEGCAKVYYEDCGISSIGIRPFVVYGPLRDQGDTSTPTTAMKMAVLGKPYEISYGGEFGFQYVDDTAQAFINACDLDFEGAAVYNLGGNSVSMDDVVSAIEAAVPEAKGLITYKNVILPFPKQARNDELAGLIGPVCRTPLTEGVRKSVEMFKNSDLWRQV